MHRGIFPGNHLAVHPDIFAGVHRRWFIVKGRSIENAEGLVRLDIKQYVQWSSIHDFGPEKMPSCYGVPACGSGSGVPKPRFASWNGGAGRIRYCFVIPERNKMMVGESSPPS